MHPLTSSRAAPHRPPTRQLVSLHQARSRSINNPRNSQMCLHPHLSNKVSQKARISATSMKGENRTWTFRAGSLSTPPSLSTSKKNTWDPLFASMEPTQSPSCAGTFWTPVQTSLAAATVVSRAPSSLKVRNLRVSISPLSTAELTLMRRWGSYASTRKKSKRRTSRRRRTLTTS